MEVVLLLAAERDLQEAYSWVGEHRQGREQFFLQDVELWLEHLKRFPLVGRVFGVIIVVYSSQDTLLVSSTLSNPIGLSFTQSSTSAKIPKRFKSDFQNRGAPLDLPFCWRCECGTQNKKRTPDQTGKVWQPVALLEGFVCRFLSLSVGICLGDNLFSSRNFWT